MESNKRKSRDQKFFEFFITLQKEYIVAEIRKKIYPDASGKEKSEEIMRGKKKKIFDIAMKNSLKTIFPDMQLGGMSLYDEDLRIQLYGEVYGGFGMPNFIYRDSVQEQRLGWKDKKCYYYLDNDFKTRDGNIGVLKSVDFDKETCVLSIDGSLEEYSFDDVSRIL